MIADRIKLARRKAGLSLRGLSDAMKGKVTAQAIGKYYATDPEYGNKLVRIMRMPEVQAAWKAVAGERAA